MITNSVQIVEEYHFIAFQEKCMPCALKGNGEKGVIIVRRWPVWFFVQVQYHGLNFSSEVNL